WQFYFGKHLILRSFSCTFGFTGQFNLVRSDFCRALPGSLFYLLSGCRQPKRAAFSSTHAGIRCNILYLIYYVVRIGINVQKNSMEEVNKQFSAKAKHDFKLIQSAVEDGNEKAYAELMQIYKKPVYHVVLKMVRNPDDAKELTIEAFAKALRNLNKVNHE